MRVPGGRICGSVPDARDATRSRPVRRVPPRRRGSSPAPWRDTGPASARRISSSDVPDSYWTTPMLAVRPVPTSSAHDRPVVELGADPLGDGDGALELGARQEDGELLAAHARRRVDPAQVAAQQLGEGPQCLVAGGMAAAVVDALEVVEVGEEERQRRVEPARTGDLALERLDEATAVHEARQRVGDAPARGRPGGAGRSRARSRPARRATRRAPTTRARSRLRADRRTAGSRRRSVDSPRSSSIGSSPTAVPDPGQLAVVVEDAPAGGAGRLDRRVEDHRQEPARVVGRGQGVADVRDRLARRPDPAAAGAFRAGARGTRPGRTRRAGRA